MSCEVDMFMFYLWLFKQYGELRFVLDIVSQSISWKFDGPKQ